MVVAVQKGLGHLKEELRTYGYDTVTYGEYHHPIDALVYVGDIDMGSLTNYSQLPNSWGQPHGIFLVNARDKSTADIAGILNRKTYSPLF